MTYTPTTAGAQPLSFRKFFKFQVVKPLDVKTKFYNDENDEVYLEAQIQNLTAGPICLEKVALESSHLFTGKFNFPKLNGIGNLNFRIPFAILSQVQSPLLK